MLQNSSWRMSPPPNGIRRHQSCLWVLLKPQATDVLHGHLCSICVLVDTPYISLSGAAKSTPGKTFPIPLEPHCMELPPSAHPNLSPVAKNKLHLVIA